MAIADYTQSIINRFHSSYMPVPICGCWLWEKATFGRGYGWFFIAKIGRKRLSEKAHRASWLIHFGDIPEGMHVLHRCDVPLCVNPSHLFLGTNLDNIKDRLLKDRPKSGVRGMKHPRAKLTDEMVLQVRASYPWKYGERVKLANKLGVSKHTLSSIIYGRSWR